MTDTPAAPATTTEVTIVPVIALEDSSDVVNIEVVTGVTTTRKDSHKSRWGVPLLNMLLGDKGAFLPPGCPLRREPRNLTTETET